MRRLLAWPADADSDGDDLYVRRYLGHPDAERQALPKDRTTTNSSARSTSEDTHHQVSSISSSRLTLPTSSSTIDFDRAPQSSTSLTG